jgi:hypothetical protein
VSLYYTAEVVCPYGAELCNVLCVSVGVSVCAVCQQDGKCVCDVAVCVVCIINNGCVFAYYTVGVHGVVCVLSIGDDELSFELVPPSLLLPCHQLSSI